MLEIKNLHVEVEGKAILKGLDLEVRAGEVHAIMGPNGSGKSTLAHVLAGRSGYVVTEGSITYEGRNLLDLTPDERARQGIFLGFRYPVEIPGVRSNTFLKTIVNVVRKERGEPELDAMDFLNLMREEAARLGIGEDMLRRAVNVGFSGGEKKLSEILQMLLLDPKLAVLDETDSGLDVDALKVVADGINAFRRPDRALVLITHYQRLLGYVLPDRVHVLAHGRVARSGDKDLALEVEKTGYAAFEPGASTAAA